MILTAVSCSVYDASLLGSGPADGGHGGTSATAGHAGIGGEGDAAGQGGRGAPKGGSSGATIGDAGMMDTAGVVETGGDGPEGGTGGTLSTAGSGGTAGSATGGESTAGSGGTAGPGGGSGGSGGTSAGAGGTAPVTATGCAKLSVPIDDAMDRAHFVLSFSTAINMSDATTSAISMRIYVKDGVAGTIFNYVQDSQYRFFGVTTANRPPLNSSVGWQTLNFPVGSQPDGGSAGAGGSSPATNIAKTDVRRVGIEINAAPATAGWTNPTIVYVDSITVTTIPTAPAQNFTFDTTSTVNASTTLTTDQANGILWLNSGTNDTKATGVTLTWVASCP